MKALKAVPALTLAALVTVLPLNAAAERGPDMDFERRLNMMQEELNLSGDQRDKLEAIFAEHRRKMSEQRAATEKKVNEVLTDEQQKKLDDMQSQRKKRFEKWRERRDSDAGEDGDQRQNQWREKMRSGDSSGWRNDD